MVLDPSPASPLFVGTGRNLGKAWTHTIMCAPGGGYRGFDLSAGDTASARPSDSLVSHTITVAG